MKPKMIVKSILSFLTLSFAFFSITSCTNSSQSDSVVTESSSPESTDNSVSSDEIIHVHDWVVDEVVLAATCTSDGVTNFKCSSCDESKSEVVKATGHSEVIDEAIEATCESTGLTEGKHCSTCNEVLVEQVEIEKLEHNYTDQVLTAATCTSDGVTLHTCSYCNNTEYEIIKAKGHNEVIDEAIEATCTETGLSEGKHCSECNEVLVKQEVINMLGHNYGNLVTEIPATCNQNGTIAHYHCNDCDTYFDVNKNEVSDLVIKAKGHNFSDTYTYNENGHWYECENCNEQKYYEKHIPNVDNATEETQKYCVICEYVIEDRINHQHNMIYISAKEATCTERGNVAYYYCSGCNNMFSDSFGINKIFYIYTNAKGHSFDDELTYNDTHHWYSATCKHTDLKKNYEQHILLDGYCQTCSYHIDFSGSYGLVGSFDGGSWETDIILQEISSGVYQTSEPINFSKGDQFKIRKDGSWDYNYGANDGSGNNYSIEKDGLYFVKFTITNTGKASIELIEVQDEIPPIEENGFDVTFNYNDPENSLTVWTGTPVKGSIAHHPENISENPDIVDLYTTPIPRGDECDTANGYYYFAIDANGYLVYASYGLGDGYGSPCDGYYHNQETKDVFEAEYWSLHLEYDFWPAKTEDGRNAWTLFDFIIPEDGFVIKGHADEPVFKSFWKELTGQGSAPKQSNSYLEGHIIPGHFNYLYFSINEDRQLSMRERTDAEIAFNGEQEKETPAIRFEYDEEIDAVPTFTSVADVNALDLTAGATVENVKGVITNIRGGNVIIEDESGTAILIYDKTLQENYNVGDTIVVSGEAVLYNGHPELKDITSVVKVEGYGQVKLDSAIEVTEENVAEVWTLANNYQVMKLVKAELLEINASGSSKLRVGETEVVLYKATFPETVQVGDYIDVTCTMEAYKETAQGRPISAENAIVKYYGVNVDVDGVDGETASVTHLAALGEQVTVVASHADKAYQFKYWEKLVVGEDGTETWENVSESSSLTVTITEVTETYRAVFGFGPWENLGGDMELALQQAPKSVNSDAYGDAFAVITDPTAKFHVDGNWNNGLFNAAWRYIIVVDKVGKVAYAVNCPANGYGGPSGSGYYRHSDYADYMTNPAFNILEGYGPWTPEDGTAATKFEIVVPEGGFIITSHGAANNPLIAALTNDKLTSTEDSGLTNSVDGGSDATRIYYDEANNEIRVYNSAAAESEVIIPDNSDVVRHGAGKAIFNGTNWVNGVWANYMIVDSDGVIAYNVWNVGLGYGRPGGFYTNPKYAENNPCISVDENGVTTIVVPEGFTGLKFGYGDYLNNLYSTLSYGAVTHTSLDANGYGETAKLWNSPANPYIAEDARVDVRNGILVVNPGTVPVKEPAPVLNGTGADAISVWDGTVVPITLNDYTIAVDATGKVIYASYGLGQGYGGPADGFYHDGTYVRTPGELCGIFDLDPEFAPWPNVTEDGRNAWGLYTLTVPEGGYILSGNVQAMDDLVLALTGLTLADYTANGLFENELEDGALNGKVVNVDTSGEEIEITVGDYVPPVEEVNVTIDASAATVFTGAEGEEVVLGDYTVAIDANGKVFFASCTEAGYGGPADEFYHNGRYTWKAGQTCGIFDLNPEFAGWPNTTEDGRNAWTLYTVVVPEGCTIVTGNAEVMLPIINAIFGLEEAELKYNTLLENMTDGDYNYVIVEIKNSIDYQFINEVINNYNFIKDDALSTLNTYNWLTSTEKDSCLNLLESIEMSDLYQLNSKEEITKEYLRVENEINNLLLLAKAEDEENELVISINSLINSSLYCEVFNEPQLNSIKEQLQSLDSNYQFIDGVIDLSVNPTDLSNKCIDELQDFSKKYNIIIDTYNRRNDMYNEIYNIFAKEQFDVMVGNDYAYEFRINGYFINNYVSIPTSFTSQEITQLSDKYLNKIEKIYDEAKALYNAFNYNDPNNDNNDGSNVRIQYLYTLIGTNGLTEADIEVYVNEIRNMKTPRELYDEIKQYDGHYDDVIAAYKEEYNQVIDRALNHNKENNILENERKQYLDLIEKTTAQYLSFYPGNDQRILLTRDAYINKINVCVNSIELENVYNEFIVRIQLTATGVSVVYIKPDGTNEHFTLDLENELYELTCSASNWQRFQFKYTIDGVSTILTYDNTSFNGDVLPKGQYSADWSGKLYTDDASTAANGYFWTAFGGTYTFTFDPNAFTFNVEKK